jgi:hypothetical protein
MNDYYVYVYIDPRTYEEFYFGKGRGSRKDAHLSDNSDSEKSKQIKAIQNEGLEPIVRVIARDLSEHDALLVEKTLLWKLGKQLTNISTGHYAANFRPHETLHKKISGFDYKNGLYYFNVGEGDSRCWNDCKNLGFISAGQGQRWRDAILGFEEGDIIAAYLKGKGFVGIGKILAKARPAREIVLNNVPLLSHKLEQPNLQKNFDDDILCEYVAKVNWINALDAEDAKWKSKSGLFTTQLVRASLDNQPKTVSFLEEKFDLNFEEILS